jgi:glucokinase
VQLDEFTGMVRLLAGDIGGTNTRLRLEELTTQAVTLHEASYTSANYPHLSDIVTQFLQEANSPPPVAACFAIAGPVQNNKSKVTNVPRWGELNAHDMENKLGIKRIRLINDFAAVGYGISALQPQDIVALQEPEYLGVLPDRAAVSQASRAVLGAGTGLGKALLSWQHNGYQVQATEGGHADYAPRNDIEIGLLQFLRSRYGRVSVERVVSGPGIFAIYQYLRALNRTPASPEVEDLLVQPEMAQAISSTIAQLVQPETAQLVMTEIEAIQDPSAIISHQVIGQDNPDPLCMEAVNLFISNYGAEAGNFALNSLPEGGLYLAGGIGPKVFSKLPPKLGFQLDSTRRDIFLKSFLDKGRMRPILKKLRVLLILNSNVGLMGAALYAQTLIPHE